MGTGPWPHPCPSPTQCYVLLLCAGHLLAIVPVTTFPLAAQRDSPCQDCPNQSLEAFPPSSPQSQCSGSGVELRFSTRPLLSGDPSRRAFSPAVPAGGEVSGLLSPPAPLPRPLLRPGLPWGVEGGLMYPLVFCHCPPLLCFLLSALSPACSLGPPLSPQPPS